MARIDLKTTTLIGHADRGIIIGRTDGTLEYLRGKARGINRLAQLIRRRPVIVPLGADPRVVVKAAEGSVSEAVDLKLETIPLGDMEAHYEILCGYGARTNTWVVATESAPAPHGG